MYLGRVGTQPSRPALCPGTLHLRAQVESVMMDGDLSRQRVPLMFGNRSLELKAQLMLG